MGLFCEQTNIRLGDIAKSIGMSSICLNKGQLSTMHLEGWGSCQCAKNSTWPNF